MTVWSRAAVPVLALILGLLVHCGSSWAQCATLGPADAQFRPLTVDGNGSINVHIRCSDVALGGGGGGGGALSSVPVPCQGSTGAPVTALVANTVALVCAASTQAANGRTALNLTNANAAGGAAVYCTWDGSAPSAASWDFVVYPQGQTIFAAPNWVSSGAVQCLASAATTIKAQAVQVGAP